MKKHKTEEIVLQEAERLVIGDRQRDYDHPMISCGWIAEIWTALLAGKLKLGSKITSRDVCRLMIGMKLSRDTAHEKRDNIVDIAGYARVAERLEG